MTPTPGGRGRGTREPPNLTCPLQLHRNWSNFFFSAIIQYFLLRRRLLGQVMPTHTHTPWRGGGRTRPGHGLIQMLLKL